MSIKHQGHRVVGTSRLMGECPNRALCRALRSPTQPDGSVELPQSNEICASWITFSQSLASSVNNCAASAADEPIGSICSLARIAAETSGLFTTSAMSLLILAATSGGVPAGATTAYHVTARKPGSPDSAMVGTF